MLDRMGDPLPKGAIARFGTVRFQQGEQINVIAMSTNGSFIAAVSHSSRIHLWAKNGKLLATFNGQPSEVHHLIFSSNEQYLASSSNNRVCIWDLKQRKLQKSLSAKQGFIAFAPNSRTLAHASYKNKAITLWPDITTDQKPILLGDETVSGTAIAFSPNGKTLAVGGRAGTIRFWDVSTRKIQKTIRIKGHRGFINGLAFSPNGTTLVSRGDDWTLRWWEWQQGKLLRSKKFSKGWANALRFTDNGRFLLAAVHGIRLVRLDAKTGNKVSQWDHPTTNISCAAFSGNGSLAAIGSMNGSHQVRLIDMTRGQEINIGEGHKSNISSVAFSPDSKMVASCSWIRGDPFIYLWDVKTAKVLHRIRSKGRGVTDIAFAPQGKAIATVCWNGDPTIRLWSPHTAKKLGEMTVPNRQRLTGVAISPNGKWLACSDDHYAGSSSADSLTIWDLKTKKPHTTISTKGDIYTFALAPNGSTIAIGRRKGIDLRSTSTGELNRSITLSATRITSMSFSSNEWFLCAASYNGTLCFLEADSGDLIALCRPGAPINSCAIAPNGWIVAAAVSNAIRFWDIMTGEELHRFDLPEDNEPVALSFAPNGKYLVSGGSDSNLLLWDLRPLRKKQKPLPLKKLAQSTMESHWKALAAKRSYKGHFIFPALIQARDQTVSFLEQHLKPVPPEQAAQLRKWLKALDSKNFTIREKAARSLKAAGPVADLEIRTYLNQKPSLEVRRRLEQILKSRSEATTSEESQRRRALIILERIGSPKAIALIKKTASGSPTSPITQKAKSTLQRLNSGSTRN